MAQKATIALEVTTKGINEAGQSVGSFKKQLREANADLVNMAEKFGAASTEAQNAAKKVAGLKDAIGDAKALAETFNPDKKFVALGGALQGAVGGFSALQGAMGLFGGQGKEVEALLLKVNSAMALQQGISGIAGALDSFKLLKTEIAGGVTKAFGTLKSAIISTGIGALVVALGFLVANFDEVKKAVLNFLPGLSKVGEWIGKLVDGFTDFIGVTSEAGRQLDDFIKKSEASIKSQEEFLDANGDKFDAFTNRKFKASLDLQKKELEIRKDETKSEDEKNALILQYKLKANREIEAADADRNKKIAEDNQAHNDKINAQNKAAQAASKAAKDKQDAEEKQRLADEQKAREAAIRAKQAKIISDIKEGEEMRAQLEADDAGRAAQEKEGLDNKLAYEKATAHQSIVEAEKAKNEKLAIAKAEYEGKMALLNATGNALNAIADLVGKQTAAGKALAVAATLINTYSAIAGQLRAFAGVPIPGYAIVQAVTTGLVGFAAVRNILKTNVPGGGSGGGGSVTSLSVQAPIRPQAETTRLDQASINKVGNAASRSYVLESDVTSNQEKITRLNRAARIN